MNVIPLGIWGGYPKANSATSSFLIQHEGFSCLFDCGSGVLSSLQNHLPLRELDAAVISHYHADHIADLGSLQYSRLIPYYLGDDLPVLPIYGHDKDELHFQSLSYKGRTEGIAIREETDITIGPFTVSFCPTVHPVYCLAARFTVDDKSVVLTADTEWTEKLIQFAKDADLLISEANLYEEHKGKAPGHMSGSEAGELAERSGAKKLLLTHLPLHGDIEDILHSASSTYSYTTVEIAKPGKSYSIN